VREKMKIMALKAFIRGVEYVVAPSLLQMNGISE
jgi:hypothetical protein